MAAELSPEQTAIDAAFKRVKNDIKLINQLLSAKADLVDGKLPDSQTPDFAVSEYCGVVANQTALLAVKTPASKTPQKGDWAVRSDEGKVYIVTGNDATQAANWTALSYPVPPAPTPYNYADAYSNA